MFASDFSANNSDSKSLPSASFFFSFGKTALINFKALHLKFPFRDDFDDFTQGGGRMGKSDIHSDYFFPTIWWPPPSFYIWYI